MKTIYKITVLLIALSSITVSAQKNRVKGDGNLTTTHREVGNYDGIFIGGDFDVDIIAGTEGKITIELEENLLDYLKTEVKEGELVITWKKGYSINTTKKSRITVPVESVNEIGLGGSGNVTSSTTLKAENMKIHLSGSGNVNLPIDATTVESNLAGSGNIQLSGKATSITCSLAGSGNIRATELNADNASASISGSGDVHLGKVSSNLKVRISGSGNVTHKGAPKKDIKISGSGDVRAK